MNAFCGLFVVLTSQFRDCDYSTGPVVLSVGGGDSHLKRKAQFANAGCAFLFKIYVWKKMKMLRV